MIQCCKNDYWLLHELPFLYDLIFDYYDGPLEGVTSCAVCGQGYYYKLLAWDKDTQDCRVFNFFAIEYTGEQLANTLEIKEILHEYGGLVPPHIILPSYLPPSIATHLCVSDNGFRTGFWRRRVSSDEIVDNWINYLGLCPPHDSQCDCS